MFCIKIPRSRVYIYVSLLFGRHYYFLKAIQFHNGHEIFDINVFPIKIDDATYGLLNHFELKSNHSIVSFKQKLKLQIFARNTLMSGSHVSSKIELPLGCCEKRQKKSIYLSMT